MPKACPKDAQSLAQNLKPLIFNGLVNFVGLFGLYAKCKCTRKNRVFDCKNRANGRGGVGLGEGLFVHMLNMLNENPQVLDFQRFGFLCIFLGILWACFGQNCIFVKNML